ncbi:MAG: helix-turn-helix domain-containing protein [Pseudomonadota bacterium]
MHVPLAYRITDAASAVGISRSKLYELIKAGAVRKTRIGGCSVIEAEELRRLLQQESATMREGSAPNPP